MKQLGTPSAVVVDDDAIILTDAANILKDAGFRVFTAMHAEEALELLAENEDGITLLFTDVDMPGRIDGFELAQETARRWPDIAIVVASGRRKPGPHDLPDGSTFVGKPFSAEVVHHHLHKVLPEERKPEPLRQAAEQARGSAPA